MYAACDQYDERPRISPRVRRPTIYFPVSRRLSQLVKVCLSLSIYINYALSNYVAFSIIWNDVEPLMEKFKYKVYVEFALRTALVLVTCK